MEKFVEKRQRKRPSDNPEIQELIKARVNQEIQTSGEITLEKVYIEQLTGRYTNEYEHTDLYGLSYATADRIDPFFTDVEDVQEAKRLWNKFTSRFKWLFKIIGILLLLLVGSVLDASGRGKDFIDGIIKLLKG